MTISTIVAEVTTVFAGLPAEVLLSITAIAIIGVTGSFTQKLFRAGR